ncbi:Histidinol-phosphate aminotransferase [Candidatus Sulfobium mesophilum]|uniref:Histidinol-phosphate aminotransferase n=1 Tax=Candidatus Sulfobium mesophilum TaxID=2016548 RepID=A0A2U3QHU1_9BACT|nr:Histidinol-phosphate aminotransferase [Candidatus Sulfobium mesophilum]
MLAMNIKKLVKKEVSGLQAYNAKELPCRIKLDANESPYGFSAALKAVGGLKTNRYPDPEAKTLKGLLAKDLRVGKDSILQGNGSDELIYYLIATFGGPVLYPVPTFSMYGIIAQALGEKRIAIPLNGEFDLDLRNILSEVKSEQPKLIFLSSPNNPTGNCFSSEKMLKIIENSGCIVVVDEAYQPFASERGFLPLLKDYQNLVIMRTLSKIGLAALRTGFLIADPLIVNEVNKVRLPFNVNSLSQAVAIAALREKKELKSFIGQIVSERRRLFKEMAKINGIRPYPSEANFILFSVNDPKKAYASLLNKGILVRNMGDAVRGCLRVTVGKPGENTAFLRALKEIRF